MIIFKNKGNADAHTDSSSAGEESNEEDEGVDHNQPKSDWFYPLSIRFIFISILYEWIKQFKCIRLNLH